MEKIEVISQGVQVSNRLEFICNVCAHKFTMPRDWIAEAPEPENPNFRTRCQNCGCACYAPAIPFT